METKSGLLMRKFLLSFAKWSPLFSHQLIWKARVESQFEADHKVTKQMATVQKQAVLI